jgi:hypothetical protein
MTGPNVDITGGDIVAILTWRDKHVDQFVDKECCPKQEFRLRDMLPCLDCVKVGLQCPVEKRRQQFSGEILQRLIDGSRLPLDSASVDEDNTRE